MFVHVVLTEDLSEDWTCPTEPPLEVKSLLLLLNIASKPATGTQSYTLTKNKHLKSLKAVKLGLLVHVRVVSYL